MGNKLQFRVVSISCCMKVKLRLALCLSQQHVLKKCQGMEV
jgi:hypothetical protein